ncbi:response regulator [Corynebacterium urealyticum]|uniref:response regulator n=1 Tax=Corynebacterium urealyticum TaxID=43771 RepID=UPI0011E681F5|nr:response regulator transcription factor [Corynebacterium urealyticum]TYR16730.1 response regulator transcription factor [Corynebacterium urealyticum]TYR19158.1 response regulator transcription factor [Corynebacterium urealyticum]TYT22348.1 response regulator transcription factor [Corynebacterium urealyticum]
MITVGLADDQQLVRAGFAMVLDSQDDLSVAWEAADGAEACELAVALPVDMILMDVQMPTMDGIAATRRILNELSPTGPAGEPTRVVVLTTFDSDNYVLGAVTAGASGFLLKDADPEELINAVRTVGESTAVISPAATAKLIHRLRADGAAANPEGPKSTPAPGVPPQNTAAPQPAAARPATPDAEDDLGLVDPLTRREREILCLIAKGQSNQEIAEKLFISLPTVKTHVGRVLMKTGSRDRVHAVLFALKHHLVDPEELLTAEG